MFAQTVRHRVHHYVGPVVAVGALTVSEKVSARAAVHKASRCLRTEATKYSQRFMQQKGYRSASFVSLYEQKLEAHPVPTKMVTGSILWGLGDVVAQIVPRWLAETEQKEFLYDYSRTGRAVFFGFAIHAPLAHVHYNFLESLTVRANVKGLGIPLFKAFMEQFVYWSWFSNSLYHGTMVAMQGQGPQEIYDRIADVLWGTQIAQWKFWIPIQLLNFQFVPVRHQLNVVLATSVVWTALLSAWYPPKEDEKLG